jgi:lipopolysaccharide cholinephosphotransferase
MNLNQLNEYEMLKEIDSICSREKIYYQLAYGTVLGSIRNKGFIPWDEDIDILVWVKDYNRFCESIEKQISKKYMLYNSTTVTGYELLFSRIGLSQGTHFNTHVDVFPFAGAPKNRAIQFLFQKITYINFRLFFAKKIKISAYKNSDSPKVILLILAKIILFLIPDIVLHWIYAILARMFDPEKTGFACNLCGSYGFKEIIPYDFIRFSKSEAFESADFPVPIMSHDYLKHFYGDYMTPRK